VARRVQQRDSQPRRGEARHSHVNSHAARALLRPLVQRPGPGEGALRGVGGGWGGGGGRWWAQWGLRPLQLAASGSQAPGRARGCSRQAWQPWPAPCQPPSSTAPAPAPAPAYLAHLCRLPLVLVRLLLADSAHLVQQAAHERGLACRGMRAGRQRGFSAQRRGRVPCTAWRRLLAAALLCSLQTRAPARQGRRQLQAACLRPRDPAPRGAARAWRQSRRPLLQPRPGRPCAMGGQAGGGAIEVQGAR
jgi:hypothetical protein